MEIRTRTLLFLIAIPMVVLGMIAGPANAAADAGGSHTITFVNKSGKTLWLGSVTNKDEPDGDSVNFKSLPVLAPGHSATVTIPEGRAPGHWRGRFFARQGCAGQPGSTFHCTVGDCGPFAHRCSTGQQPVSLAEFNFDTRDSSAPWYDVSYVDGFSLPITIAPKGARNPTENGSCSKQGCSANLLKYCPRPNQVRNAAGALVLCVNPSRDEPTNYSKAIREHCPKAYAWSKQDHEPGNRTMRQCSQCNGFTVTFHA